jgi:hypothetical protein
MTVTFRRRSPYSASSTWRRRRSSTSVCAEDRPGAGHPARAHGDQALAMDALACQRAVPSPRPRPFLHERSWQRLRPGMALAQDAAPPQSSGAAASSNAVRFAPSLWPDGHQEPRQPEAPEPVHGAHLGRRRSITLPKLDSRHGCRRQRVRSLTGPEIVG